MIDLTSGQKYCFRCYSIRTNDTYDHSLLHSHHAIRGAVDAKCYNCNAHLTIVRPIETCVKCRHNLCIILTRMVNNNVDLDRARYRFNIHSFLLEYLNTSQNIPIVYGSILTITEIDIHIVTMPRVKQRLLYLLEARCVKATFMVKKKTHRTYCISCYARSTDSADDYRVVFKHYATRGEYNKKCHKCHKGLTTLKFVEDCPVCIRSCALIMSNIITKRLDLYRVYYCYDNKNGTIKHLEIK